MVTPETPLEMLRRHVLLGERHIERQHAIIQHLSDLGAPTKLALELLDLFEEIQAMHVTHLRRLKRAS
ncbi:MAG: hypothetical protein EOS81_04640 [Mesorhizobium sp.]|uniref:hypothetical protein n=1 Tax=Mesorhizobium sp. TaxID=1871066 RepID=UPI000FD52F6E|nr:hypothetical protein [Mesorhizobium sp.]RVC68046.1 hypothetical protein EN759_13215 [Mesorhizobium sp. M00.F.Ca.ET.038.03.1.1]RWF05377.1 MAG: hypothetical protein EOS81_04640 [Mesorhizobium sp.]TIV19496.1 MAG: hypothetical protein E5V95_08435 [Mesorhizobium sp.]TIW04257.1 MAG: hypothetical protein E5V77_01150 [Mesorhizobium sp.]